MQRAAIYARYSDDKQSERSIDDQILLCRTRAAQDGCEVVSVYSDAAKSGASIFGRDGLMQMMADSSKDKFDVLYVEAFDRLAREMSELMDLKRRLSFKSIRIRAIHDGDDSTINVALRGLFAQLYREDLAAKTHRGLSGRVRDGLSGGGQSYGYRPDQSKKGVLVIHDEEAAVVRRIFREYSQGKSPRAIAVGLNDDGIPGPRGARWSAGTINGSAARQNGILHNSLYIGERIWNRNRFVKDPDTGKRISRLNPEAEWQRVNVPELRIVTDEEWIVAQKVRGERITNFGELAGKRRPKRLLSGLLKCGACGAGMSIGGKDKSGRYRVRCSGHAERGTCPDPKTFYLDTVEDLVLSGLLKQLREPDHLKLYIETYHAEMRKLIQERTADKAKLENGPEPSDIPDARPGGQDARRLDP